MLGNKHLAPELSVVRHRIAALVAFQPLDQPGSMVVLDFVVGRIYQMIGSSTFDKIAKKGSDGSTLEVKDWITDPATLKSIAETKFRQANCSMIKR